MAKVRSAVRISADAAMIHARRHRCGMAKLLLNDLKRVPRKTRAESDRYTQAAAVVSQSCAGLSGARPRRRKRNRR